MKKEQSTLAAKDRVALARHQNRPNVWAYIKGAFSDFLELHGDRAYGDDGAIVGGIATFNGIPVTVIGHLKEDTLEKNLACNFGMPNPEGYRKALRLMKQAEKFNRPIISFINTPGAFCGVDAEERGQGEAIARSIMEMSALKVPVLCILVGEGGSGGALATAVGNEVWMTEHATYAILSPEGYSSILWKTEQRAEEAAKVMKLTAQDLAELGVIDRIVPEFGGATAQTVARMADTMKDGIKEFLKKYGAMSGNDLVEARYQRFRKF